MNTFNRILIVDDDKNNLTLCKEILQSKFEIETAENGSMALRKIETFQPSLLLLDWDMPDMNGLDVLKSVKSNYSTQHIQVVIMTGLMTLKENMLYAYEAGVSDFIRKPFDNLELIARVNSVMRTLQYYHALLDYKNIELSNLRSQLIENTELFNKLVIEIDNLSQSIPPDLQSIKEKFHSLRFTVQQKIIDDLWKRFEDYLQKINPHFFSRLIDKHPNLSKSEIKLCALLYLNLNTKEIAAILSQEYDSIRVSRTRLRKKLNLENEEKIVNYLLRI